MTDFSQKDPARLYGTTILAVRKPGKMVMIGDGQVSLGNTVMKGSARKVRRIADGRVVAGFAGATADAFALFERLEEKLERYKNNLERAAVELTKDWRTDKYLQKLEAMLLVADETVTLVVTGQGDDCHQIIMLSPSDRAEITHFLLHAASMNTKMMLRSWRAKRWRSRRMCASIRTQTLRWRQLGHD